ncbi:MAG: peptidase M4 family protein, partial [Bacteroidales bacterium]|nr:peptidase M4 family protein [Bacteroidales bacterium]
MKTTVTLAKSFALMAMFAIINLNFNLTYSQIFHQKQANQIVPGSKKVFKDAQKGTIKYIEFDQRKRMINQADEALLSTSLNLSPLYHFKVKNEHRDQKGILHQKYQLHYKNIPVEGFVYHLHKENGLVSSANGEYFIADDIDTEPSISESAAFTKAINFSNAESYIWEGDESLRTRGELVILPKNDKFYLAYKFDIWSIAPTSRKWIFVDAHLGEILNTIDRIHIVDSVGTAVTKYNGTRNITTDYTGTNYRLRESGRRVETYDLNNSTNYSSAVDFTDSDNYWDVIANQDNAAYDAHFGTEMTYDFYFHRFGRNSYDNAGSTLKSYVHYSTNYANAFWNGSFMTYGDGDGVTFSALTSLDIVAHEITHAVTEYSAGLIYSYESGALNESFSDIFGISVDFYANPTTANYYCGDQVHLTGNGIRNMANPNEFGDPDTYLGT